mgnify:CR=1 FL=1
MTLRHHIICTTTVTLLSVTLRHHIICTTHPKLLGEYQMSDAYTYPSSFSCRTLNWLPLRGLVIKSAIIKSVGTYTMFNSPLLIRSTTKKYLILICFVLAVPNLLFSSRVSTDLLSSPTGVGPRAYPWSIKNSLIQRISVLPSVRATSSASVLLLVTIACFEVFHNTGVPFRVTTSPLLL